MHGQESQDAWGIWVALFLAVIVTGSGAAGAQAQDSGIVSFSFRPGELRDREAKAAEQCKRQNLDAALTAIEYANSAERFQGRLRYRTGDRARHGTSDQDIIRCHS